VKIVTVLGARPQFIKAKVVSDALLKYDGIEEILVHTGQHYDEEMSNIFFQELEISKPRYNLNVSGGSHGVQTAKMLEGIENILQDECPDLVIVYGDTNSTLAGALAAAKLNIEVAHIEAGLRSFDRSMPEEVNRIVADHLATFNFAPTELAMKNLESEGLGNQAYVVGDVMLDTARFFSKQARIKSSIVSNLGLTAKNFVLATVHRASNTDNVDNLKTLLESLSLVAETIPVVMPLHPRTRKVMAENNLGSVYTGINFIDPVGYLDMVVLQENSRLIATDSGGVQKEAFFFGVPSVIFRDNTEWMELLELDWSVLCPPSLKITEISRIILGRLDHVGIESHPYGEGSAAKDIARILFSCDS
tara:strand:+ start:240 stop:1325 length:1086 start_codon:yes stop_codon:yes gene_type:complete